MTTPPDPATYLADPEALDADLVDCDDGTVAELADDLGMHLLLSHRLGPDEGHVQRNLAAIQAALGKPDASHPAVGARPAGRSYRRAIATVLAAAVAVHVLIIGFWIADQEATPPIAVERLDGEHWVAAGALPGDRIIDSGDTVLRLLPEPGVVLQLDRHSILLPPPATQAGWRLQTGRLTAQIDADHGAVDLIGNQSRISGTGHWTLAVSRWRDRLTVVAGSPGCAGHRGPLHRAAPGETWDIPAGGGPRPWTAGLAARFPLALPAPDADAQVHEALLERYEQGARDPDGQTRLGPDRPFLIPFMPPPAYDLACRVRRREGDEVLALQLLRAEAPPAVLMLDGWQSTRQGFNLLGGDHDAANPTVVRPDGPLLTSGTWHHVVAQVRPVGIGVYCDGALLTVLPAQSSVPAAVELAWPPQPPAGHLALHAWRDSFELRDLRCVVHADGVGAAQDMYGPQ